MVPSPLPSHHLSSPLRGDAISTAASPLRGSFNLSCRSPVRPSFEADIRRSLYHAASSSFLKPPSLFPIDAEAPKPRRTNEESESHHGDGSSRLSEDSPTDQTWFLQPQSPGLLPLTNLRVDEGKLGVLSAINIIVGKTVGVGAYSVPSAIFSGVGSVGMTLLLWVIGSLISFCGLAVYLDLGTAIPRSGGERVYLERIFRRPRMLATCMFMAYVVLLGFSAPNAIVLGEYALYAFDAEVNRWNVRAIATGTVSLLCYVHARHPRFGLRLINILGVVKMLILVIVIVSGVAGGLMGVGADRELLKGRRLDVSLSDVAPRSTAQRNFSDIWAGSSAQPYDYATALLKVIYCFRGYSTANQVLSDVKNPVRTLKIAAPIALTLVSLAYLAINVAFFLVVDKDDFKSAGVTVAGIFFRNVFGPGIGAHILPWFVIISAAGNIAATSFAQARVNEELARDGLLPWSGFWSPSDRASSPQYISSDISARVLGKLAARPIQAPPSRSGSGQLTTPSRGLLLHWLVSVLVIILPPPGRIYNFLVDIGGYPVSVISVAVSAGLYYLHRTPSERWSTPYRAPKLAVTLFAASNCLLLLLPWIPPIGGKAEDVGVIWFAYPATSLAVLGSGAAWWLWWSRYGNGAHGTPQSYQHIEGWRRWGASRNDAALDSEDGDEDENQDEMRMPGMEMSKRETQNSDGFS
ncbi:hypothetical protein GQ53DRAFT_810068 [Thozetella sp. PMI_491]|nr:hypothetical protein GQ53DRAFT_810068 [Thozetella sp. PMI_491]